MKTRVARSWKDGLRWAVGRERLVTVDELADWLGVPLATIYAWRYRGDGPPSYKVGRHVRFRTEEVEEWLTSLRDPGGGAVTSVRPQKRRAR